MRIVMTIATVTALTIGASLTLQRAYTSNGNEDAKAAPVTVVTLIHGIPGRETELRDHLLSLTAPTLAETGCLRYDLYQPPEQSHEFMRYEVWTSREALEAHKLTPHLRASFERRQREGWTTEILAWTPVPAAR